MTKQNRYLTLFAALATSTGLLAISESALAAPSLVVDTGAKQSLGRDEPYFYNKVTLKSGGTLSVLGAGGGNGTGRLHIKANHIIIESDAILDAKGAGHKGVSGAQGGGMGGGAFLMASGGGGGAYFGNGGAATNMNCGTGAAFAAGGTAYGDLNTFGLGSAGGSSGVAAIGAAGGGAIILEAALIDINGIILADGNDGIPLSGNGSGGGAGGEIRLLAHTLSWGVKAKVSAVGGKGAAATNNGGSGGGGLIMIHGGGTAPDMGIFTYAGGAPALANCMANAGANGVLDQDTMSVCPDLDGDGKLAALCAGLTEDCDDADPAVNPDASEICDGVDNDCNTLVDDGQTDCAAGLTCMGGKCVGEGEADAGTGDGGLPKGEFRVEYRGGCSISTAQSSETSHRAWLSFGLLALSVGMIRRIKSKRAS